ncbi:1,4-alpha-glucan branching enzyme [Paenibacillus sp. yr247]|uniref:1,4-alpha-glucan branching protein domain-containing protein n=1 Tax=Paenibacillus sp. yr247 TaxID=1761880 RepID=UPI000885C1AE|nr:1,4-alpha-glucan branching protein domain-containing protein [Paenibacillus sp. yr247]SDN30179.1 1,4-alpha-glucan branching enzyme [Paenibacillus sp. yr247]
MSTNVNGYVALLLHAHIPYVRHEESNITLEERWFFEAVVDSYLPLIEMMERLLEEDVPFHLTLSLSPPLLAMLEDSGLQKRLRKHLASLCELAQREVFRLWGHADFGPTARLYADQYHRLLALYDRLRGDLIGKFRSLRNSGCLELITCAATHAFLPLVKNDPALRAQLEAAVQEFRRHFGSAPAGIWLPECGYTPAVEPHLQAMGLRYFVVDAHAHAQAVTANQAQGRANAKSTAGAPLRTQSGACAFARDLEAGAQVWSAEVGYPSDADYREYYRDIGYDLGRSGGAEWEYLKPYVLPDGKRIHTGFKYYRVTGAAAGDAKAPYHPARAAQKAQQHAEHFVASRVAQLRRLAEEREAQALAVGCSAARPAAPPVIVCPYDAELFGHWWYEGHQWLEAVLRGFAAARSHDDVVADTTTLGGYAAAHAPTTEAKLPVSSWGRGGYAEVWLQPRSQWVHPLLHAAEDRLVLAAQKHPNPQLLTGMQQRALNQAARELMLAQSSDWTFILDAETVTDYAVNRIETHLSHFHKLLNALETACSDKELSELVISLERRSPFLPELHYLLFQPSSFSSSFSGTATSSSISTTAGPASSSPFEVPSISITCIPFSNTHSTLRILMLAWEYPPRVIGGLARAVCDLSRQLAASGHEVHVITCLTPDCLPYELSDGVHIHRVEVLQSTGTTHFLDWVFQMNLAFTDSVLRLSEQGMLFDIIHAHDWLVFYAAKECKSALHLPLLATIHATEYGRNQGKLDTPVQKRIHALENKLADEADQLVVCSLYMQQEVMRLFQVPMHKITHIPNGVVPFRAPAASLQIVNPLLSNALSRDSQNRILAFLGRLVYEKGVHILISAMRLVLKRYPEAKLVIAGSGPELEALQQLAAPLGDRVSFTGFLDETDKNLLLHTAELCVFPSLYEPFGLVALEAMASGTPLIVSDTGGLAEIVDHGINGCKVPPGDANALAWQITQLLQNPNITTQLTGAASTKVSDTFSWEQIRTRTTETYKKLILLHSQKSGIFLHQKEIIK